MARVLVIPDLHCPWEHPKALSHLRRTRDKFNCDRVVCLGDEIDAASFSVKWTPSPDMPSPSDELLLAIESMEKFYLEFPNVEVCESNHGMRLFRKARVTGMPSMVLRRYEEILNYPEGWKINESVEIDGVYYFHGEGLSQSSWRTAHEKLKQSIVIGHLHSGAGVMYSRNKRKQYFSMNAGCLIDPTHKAFDYGKHMLTKPNVGCGIVLDGEEAYFIPLKD